MYENCKIYGPCESGGRLRIVVRFPDGSKHTVSYPKYLVECHLNRYLEKDEQVDHIDGNPLNNELSNLRVLKLGEHQVINAKRNKDVTVTCAYCGKEFTIKGSNLRYRNRADRHQAGYFCSKQCSGRYGLQIQRGTRTHITKERITPTKVTVTQYSKGSVVD